MQNFNTNQTRHFYVAKAINENVAKDAAASGTGAASNLDIALGVTDTDELFFSYKNADGLITRSDTFSPKRITSLKNTAAADMNVPIIAHKIALSDEFTPSNAYIGKVLSCMVTVHQMFDFDESNSLTYNASLIGNATNMASAAALFKALAVELAKVLPENLVKVYAGSTEVTKKTAVADITGSPAAIYLIPKVQKYVRGKLSAETATLSVAFRLHDGEDTVWGKDTADTVANLNTADSLSLTPTAIESVYNLADLEYFALGERGDVYRNMLYPYNYETTYAIDLSKTYDVVTIEYYWAGNVENVQKSPRMIQIACEVSNGSSIASTIISSIQSAIAGE